MYSNEYSSFKKILLLLLFNNIFLMNYLEFISTNISLKNVTLIFYVHILAKIYMFHQFTWIIRLFRRLFNAVYFYKK